MSARTGKMYLDLVNSKMPHATMRERRRPRGSMYDGAFRVSAAAREMPAETTVCRSTRSSRNSGCTSTTPRRRPSIRRCCSASRTPSRPQYLQSLAGTGIAGTLARMETAYRWQFIEEQFKQRMAVTPADLMRVAKKYLTRDNSVTGVMERER